jgi:hypothetical protein
VLGYNLPDGTIMSLTNGKRIMVLHYIAKIYPAPTLDEMLSITPRYIQKDGGVKYARMIWPEHIGYIEPPFEEPLIMFPYEHGDCKDNPATACARLRMWLVDEGYIK